MSLSENLKNIAQKNKGCLISFVKNKKKTPQPDMVAIFFKIWKNYKSIFLTFEAARAKELGDSEYIGTEQENIAAGMNFGWLTNPQ
jgi:hypothetical protein